MSLLGKWVFVFALVGVAGCGRQGGPAPGTTASVVAVRAPADVPVEALQSRAETALRERRYYAPVGDSAIDHYLALRDRTPGDPGVAAALTELQPYLLIAGEQALLGGDLVETQRLLVLLARVDDNAPALPRLRDGLRRAQRAQQLLASAAADTAAAATRKPAALAAADSGNTVAVVPAPPPASRPQPSPIEPAAVPRPASAPPALAPAVTLAAVPSALPKLLKDAQPRYPLNALKRKIEGSVRVAFSVEPDGSIAGLRVVSATPVGLFDDAALAAVTRWRFEATGRRVETQRTLSFRLPKG
ncbi:MAG: energy transducer TonB [Lysobacter sp.]